MNAMYGEYIFTIAGNSLFDMSLPFGKDIFIGAESIRLRRYELFIA